MKMLLDCLHSFVTKRTQQIFNRVWYILDFMRGRMKEYNEA